LETRRSEWIVAKNVSARCGYDGPPTCFDLLTGRVVTGGGDLCVAVERSALPDGQRKYDWTVTVAAAEGGVKVSSDAFMYLAPENNYEREVKVSMSASDPKWSPVTSIPLYLKCREIRGYARVVLQVSTSADHRPAASVSVHSFLNPNGSRNLEYDANQDLDVRK
jgi:hypothetical protein